MYVNHSPQHYFFRIRFAIVARPPRNSLRYHTIYPDNQESLFCLLYKPQAPRTEFWGE